MLDISLAPRALFYLGGLPVTNTLLWTVVVSVLTMVVFVWVAQRMKRVPGPLQNTLEVLVEESYNFTNSVTGSEKKTRRVFPFVFTLFIFILISNLLTFLPGQAAVTLEKAGGVVPFFRAVMSDYGLIFVLTMIGILTTQIVAIAVHGPLGYVGKFINLKGFKDFFKNLFKGKFKPGLIGQGFLDLFLGIMDFVGEFAKIVSLSFRLFGNIFASEVITAVMLFLAPFIIPLPFKFLGILTAVVQAFVFATLTLIYITMASEIEEEKLAEEATI